MGRTVAGYVLPDSLNDLTPLQKQASALKQQFEGEVHKIRAEPSLSAEGKQTLIARAWIAFKPAFDGLRQLDQDEYSRARREQQTRLIGLQDRSDPSAVISARDAIARARALPRPNMLAAGDPKQVTFAAAQAAAEELLSDAELSDDAVLARAVLAVAMDRGAMSVVDAYKARYPDETDAVDDYYELLRFDPEASLQVYYLYGEEQGRKLRPPELSTMDAAGDDKVAWIAERPVATAAPTGISPRPPLDALPTSWTSAPARAEARDAMREAPRIEV